MVIALFTQDGCMQCEMLKEKLTKEGIQYAEHDAGTTLNTSAPDYFEKNPEWRTNGTVAAMGLLQMDRSLPIVIIDDQAHNYHETVKILDQRKQAQILPVQQVVCEELCAVAV